MTYKRIPPRADFGNVNDAVYEFFRALSDASMDGDGLDLSASIGQLKSAIQRIGDRIDSIEETNEQNQNEYRFKSIEESLSSLVNEQDTNSFNNATIASIRREIQEIRDEMPVNFNQLGDRLRVNTAEYQNAVTDTSFGAVISITPVTVGASECLVEGTSSIDAQTAQLRSNFNTLTIVNGMYTEVIISRAVNTGTTPFVLKVKEYVNA